MALIKLKDASIVPKKTQFLVYGYIHDHQYKFELDIPKDIILLCLLFSRHADEWDAKCKSKSMRIYDKTLKLCKDTPATAYCQAIIESGVFEWRFKIDKVNQFGVLVIGIWKVRHSNQGPIQSDQPPCDEFFYHGKGNGYG